MYVQILGFLCWVLKRVCVSVACMYIRSACITWQLSGRSKTFTYFEVLLHKREDLKNGSGSSSHCFPFLFLHSKFSLSGILFDRSLSSGLPMYVLYIVP
jgi:hypothetical protein